jgi:hypothetical protein
MFDFFLPENVLRDIGREAANLPVAVELIGHCSERL